MKRKIISLLLTFILLLPVSCGQEISSQERFEGSFLGVFDTVSTVIGYAENKEEFTEIVNRVYDELNEYHKLYDIYHEYSGINNLMTINENAGKCPVAVDEKIIDLLTFCKKMYYETDGKVNVCMGSVLGLWHEERTYGIENPDDAKIPSMDDLKKAYGHTDIEKLIIDEENMTVFLSDENMRLDVGAVAKGYAVEKVREILPAGTVLSVGGNVITTGAKPDGEGWGIGLQDPFSAEDSSHTVIVKNECVVSSGIYQRNYVVDEKVYHHIIDPQTLMPGERYAAVTVISSDSGICDALSTALFLTDIEEGEKLLEKFGAYAMWTDLDGKEYFSKGFEGFIK